MSPEEKSKELLFKFYDIADVDLSRTKQCALICVDEILNEIKHVENNIEFIIFKSRHDYYNKVKQEINKTKPKCKCNHNSGRTKIESEAFKCNDCDAIFINTKYTK